MKNRTRWMLIAGALLFALLVISLTMSDPGIEVESALALRDSLQVMITEEGRTRVRDRYVVAAPSAGRLARIEVDEGDPVKEGALIARIYPLPEGSRGVTIAQAQVKAAEARRSEAVVRIEEAEALVAQLEREVTRRRVLAQDSILSKEEFERDELSVLSARRQLESARASLLAIEADVEAAKAMLIGTDPQVTSGKAVNVRAPSAGRVLRVLEENERVVQAGTPLIAIGNSEGLEVVVDVLSEDAVQIKPGNPVLIEEWGGSTLHGSVLMVEPDAFTKVSALGVEEQRVNVIADLYHPPASLGSGYRVEANIIVWESVDVLTVPTSALFQLDGAWTVFVIRDGKAAHQPIKTGHRSTELIEVLEGLDAGEKVILYPSDQVQDGVKVHE